MKLIKKCAELLSSKDYHQWYAVHQKASHLWCTLKVDTGVNIVFTDLDNGIENTLSKSANKTEVKEIVGTPGGCAAIQRELNSLLLNRLEKKVDQSIIKFTEGKCQVPHLVKNNARYQCSLRVDSKAVQQRKT